MKVDLNEIGWKNVDWICVTLDRSKWCVLVKMVMNPSHSIKYRKLLHFLWVYIVMFKGSAPWISYVLVHSISAVASL